MDKMAAKHNFWLPNFLLALFLFYSFKCLATNLDLCAAL